MKFISKIVFLSGILLFSIFMGCKNFKENSETAIRSNIPVTITQIHTGKMVEYLELSATSLFLKKALIKSPVTGYIDNLSLIQGDTVEKNQVLLKIRTKESLVLINDSIQGLKFKNLINVKSTTKGLISAIEHSNGDYVTEGDQLCQIVIPESFVFILDVPFEMSENVKTNTSCDIILPDNHQIKGIIKSFFPSMAGNSQTERFIVSINEGKNLPENLIAKVRMEKTIVNNAISLPKSCVLTNETMNNFWVMKLINDSMAVKIPVTTGITEGNNVQIILPLFSITDKFLSSGNFGLGDTAYVKVVKNPEHE